MKKLKKALCLFLALVMCLGMLPVSVFAAETPEHEHNAGGWACEYTAPVTEPDCKHTHDATCGGAEDCTHVCGEDCVKTVTEGFWTCKAPEAKAEATGEDGTAIEAEVPAEVKAFLDAVAAIPEITPENAVEVSEYVYGEVSEAYEALLGTEYEERDDVQEAVAVYAAAIEAVDAALDMESDNFATIQEFTGSMTAVDEGVIPGSSKGWVGDEFSFSTCPLRQLQTGYYTDTYVADRYYYKYKGTTDRQGLLAEPVYCELGTYNDPTSLAHGHDSLEVVMKTTAGKTGTANTKVLVVYYMSELNRYINGVYYNGYFGRTLDCTINVYARYQLNYDTQGGSFVSSNYSDVMSNSATLNVTSTKPTKTGYIFKGWADTAGADSATYTAGSSVVLRLGTSTDSTGTPEGNSQNPVSKTLYAVWELRTDYPYKVRRIDAANGNLLGEEVTHTGTFGATVNATATDKTYTGYTFKADDSRNVLSDTLNNDHVVLKLYFTQNRPILSIRKELTTTQVKVGQNVTYTITVTNSGNADAANVKVADPLKTDYLQFVSCKINGGEAQTVEPEHSLYDLGTVRQGGGTATLEITAKVLKLDGSGKLPNNIAYLNPKDPTKPSGGTSDDTDETGEKPGEKLKLESITKTLVTQANKVSLAVPEDILGAKGITIPETDSVSLRGDNTESKTLLYKITITGDPGAAYKVTELGNGKKVTGDTLPEGITLIQGTMSGTLPENGSTDIYVTMVVFARDLDENLHVVNTAKLESGESSTTGDPEKGTDGVETPAVKIYTITVERYIPNPDWNPDDPNSNEFIKIEEQHRFVELPDGTRYELKDNEPAPVRSRKLMSRAVEQPPTQITFVKTFPYEEHWYSYDDPVTREMNGGQGVEEGTIDGENVTIKLYYALDEKGTIGPDGRDTYDGTPDKYQAKVVYVAGANGKPINVAYYANVVDEAGNLAAEGQITLTTQTADPANAETHHFRDWTAQADYTGWNFAPKTNAALSGEVHAKGGAVYTFTANFEAHTFQETITNPATCTEDGSKTLTCTCGYTKTETINKLGHHLVTDEAKAPTCTETGLTEGKHCDRDGCGHVETAQTEIPALGHHLVTDEAKAPTCTETGLTEGKHCDRDGCGHVETEQTVIPALGHHLVTDEAKAPTCTETGLTEGKHCDRDGCGHVETAQTEIPALGHHLVTDEAKAPTCTETGLTEGKHCDRDGCGHVETEQTVIPALGHDWDKWQDNGDGTHSQVCTRDKNHVNTVKEAHTYGEWSITKEATETEKGEREHTCIKCGHKETEEIPATGVKTFTVTFDSNGGSAVASQTVANGGKAVEPAEPTQDGFTFDGWYLGDAAYDFNTAVTGDITLVARWTAVIVPVPTPRPSRPDTDIGDENPPLANVDGLNSKDHFAYIAGYPDGTVRPMGNLTRAEAATIFYRLMEEEYRVANWAEENSFTDVTAGEWHNVAISVAAKAGILKGYPDGTFRPNQTITRAEFATMAIRFMTNDVSAEGVGYFEDTKDHWAAENIRMAVAAGWVTGEAGGVFRPEDDITRVEVMELVNRMLDRLADADHMLDSMKTWPDNPASAPYYSIVQEATNGHKYTLEGTTETWTELFELDWVKKEAEWVANKGADAKPDEK